MLSKSFINKVKTTVNIYDLVSEYTTLRKSNENIYVGICPNKDHKDKDPSFRVWIKEQSWACMVCHNGKKDSRFKCYGSDCIAFIMWIEKLDFESAVLFLADKYNIPREYDRNKKIYDRNKKINNIFMECLSQKAYKYLIGRGLDDVDINKWRLGSDGSKITFPLIGRYGEIYGFTRRWIKPPEGSKDKYRNTRNSKSFNKGSYIYGAHNIDNDFNEIRIVEGPMDVILSSKYGAKNVVSVLGTAFTDEHAKIIKQYNKIPVFIFDGDKAGKEAIHRAAIKMADIGVSSKILILKDGEDLADASIRLKDSIEDFINKNSIKYGIFLCKDAIIQYRSKLLELNMEYKQNVNNIIMNVPLLSERQAIEELTKKEIGI